MCQSCARTLLTHDGGDILCCVFPYCSLCTEWEARAEFRAVRVSIQKAASRVFGTEVCSVLVSLRKSMLYRLLYGGTNCAEFCMEVRNVWASASKSVLFGLRERGVEEVACHVHII